MIAAVTLAVLTMLAFFTPVHGAASAAACLSGTEPGLPSLNTSSFGTAEIVASTTYESSFYVLTRKAEIVGDGDGQFVLLFAQLGSDSWSATSGFAARLLVTSIAIRKVDNKRVLFAFDRGTGNITAFDVDDDMTRLFKFGDFSGASTVGMVGLDSLVINLIAVDSLLVADPVRQCLRLYRMKLNNNKQAKEKTSEVPAFTSLGACSDGSTTGNQTSVFSPVALAVRGSQLYIVDQQTSSTSVIRFNIGNLKSKIFPVPELSAFADIRSIITAASPDLSDDALLFLSPSKALVWFPGQDSQTIVWPAAQSRIFAAAYLHPGISGSGAFNATFLLNATVDVSASLLGISCPDVVPGDQSTNTSATPSPGTPAPDPTSSGSPGSAQGAANQQASPTSSDSNGVIIGASVAGGILIILVIILLVVLKVKLREAEDDPPPKAIHSGEQPDPWSGPTNDDPGQLGGVRHDDDFTEEPGTSTMGNTTITMSAITMSEPGRNEIQTQELLTNQATRQMGNATPKPPGTVENEPTPQLLERTTAEKASISGSQKEGGLSSSTYTTKLVGSVDGEDSRSFVSAQQMIDEGRFSKLKLIGRGAFGSVYNCVLDDGQVVAMKEMLLPEDAETKLKEIIAEVDLVSQLSHPNVVRYFGCRYEREENQMLLFMELAAGGSLATISRQASEVSRNRVQKSMSEQIAQRYFRQVLEGLAYIHSKGVVHRDLKCDNVFLSQDGQCKLGDFGTSRVMESTTQGGTALGRTMVGTPLFMAPEMILEQTDDEGSLGYTKKADIWSFGILCLEFMNRGNPPWPAFSNQGAAFFHIASEKGKPIIPDGVSSEFRDFIGRCCERDPAKRATATDLLQDPWLDAAQM